jgi:hypothetical protein
MLGRSKGNAANYDRGSPSVHQMPRSAVASSAPPEASSRPNPVPPFFFVMALSAC